MRRRRFQFSLRALLASMVFACIAIASLCNKTWAAGLIMLLVLYATPGIAPLGVMYGGRPVRAFAIGSLCPAFVGFWLVARQLEAFGWGPDLIPLAQDALPRAAAMLQLKVAVVWAALIVSGVGGTIASSMMRPNPEPPDSRSQE